MMGTLASRVLRLAVRVTIEHQSQEAHNDTDQSVRLRRTLVRIECQSDDGLVAFGCDRPEVEARSNVGINAALHRGPCCQGRSRYLEVALAGLDVAGFLQQD